MLCKRYADGNKSMIKPANIRGGGKFFLCQRTPQFCVKFKLSRWAVCFAFSFLPPRSTLILTPAKRVRCCRLLLVMISALDETECEDFSCLKLVQNKKEHPPERRQLKKALKAYVAWFRVDSTTTWTSAEGRKFLLGTHYPTTVMSCFILA